MESNTLERGSAMVYAVMGLVVVGFVGFVIYLIVSGSENENSNSLPPTDMSGHVEESPESHVLDEPMDEKIQKHMLEHSDGTGIPGIIVQYNCEDYECPDDLVDNLEAIALDYENVYLAPGEYSGMIILTRLGRIEVLEEFDEEKIRDFI